MNDLDLKKFNELEERVQKGRSILKMIEELKDNINELPTVKSISFYDKGGYLIINSNFYDLTDEILQAYLKLANKKIKQLEREFKYLWDGGENYESTNE